jgi:hypothetical protein
MQFYFTTYRLLGVSMALSIVGCSTQAGQLRDTSATRASRAEPTPTASSQSPDTGAAISTRYDAGWKSVQAMGQSVELPVPDADTWTVEEGGRWWHIRHAPSASELLIRTWRAPRSSSPQTCEHQARLWRPQLPQVLDDHAIVRDRLRAPIGFRTQLSVGVESRRGQSMVAGVALAFGSRPGRCLAMVYMTKGEGPAAESIVAERLAIITSNAFARARELSIDDRARPAGQRLP